jgi:hypothetical protein
MLAYIDAYLFQLEQKRREMGKAHKHAKRREGEVGVAATAEERGERRS